jgi:hypothetical protein
MHLTTSIMPTQTATEIESSIPESRKAELAGQPWYIVQTCVTCSMTVAEARAHLGLDESCNRIRSGR